MLQGLQTGACFVAVRNLKAGDRNLCSVERLLLLGMNTEKHIQRKSHPACRMAFLSYFLFISPDNTSLVQIVWGQLDGYFVSRENTDKVHTQLSTDMS
jgi:hypothetical protein